MKARDESRVGSIHRGEFVVAKDWSRSTAHMAATYTSAFNVYRGGRRIGWIECLDNGKWAFLSSEPHSRYEHVSTRVTGVIAKIDASTKQSRAKARKAVQGSAYRDVFESWLRDDE